MSNQMSMNLVWIVVKDFQKALKYYRDVLGLKLLELTEEYSWAEFQGKDGAIFAIAGESSYNPVKAGQNAIPTFTVSDLSLELTRLVEQGVKLVGEVEEVPGHVKLQLAEDESGNLIQFVQRLD